MEIVRPASQVKQGDLVLYTTSLKVSDLLLPGFYSIKHLDLDDGYQRLLNESRAKKLAVYIVDGSAERDAFLPTSIFMATDKDLPFNPDDNTIRINTDEIGSFNIVDGQHRVEGLRMAAEKDVRVKDFEVPVNIAVKLDYLAQMAHFLVVNTTQKSVDEGIAQRIRAKLFRALGIRPMLTLPRWIKNLVETGDDDVSLRLVDFLNTHEESPWKNRIFMADDVGKKGNRITQKTFVSYMKRYYFVQSNPVREGYYDESRKRNILLNYWIAITNIIGAEDSVLFKSVGAELFLRFSVPFFNRMINVSKGFHVDKMQETLQKCFNDAEDEAAGVGHPDFWKSGSGKAGGLNSGAVGKVCHKLSIALHRSANLGDEL